MRPLSPPDWQRPLLPVSQEEIDRFIEIAMETLNKEAQLTLF